MVERIKILVAEFWGTFGSIGPWLIMGPLPLRVSIDLIPWGKPASGIL